MVRTSTVSNLLAAPKVVKQVSKGKIDLVTAQGFRAVLQSCLDGAFMYAYLKDSLENIISGVKSHAEIFKGMVSASSGFADKADLSNQDDCYLLNLTAQQWLKCFAPTGGMGHFPMVGINMRRVITADDEALIGLLANKGIIIKPPQSIAEAHEPGEPGYTSKDIAEAFRFEEIPVELQQEWNLEWSELFDPFGAPEKKFGVATKELTIGDLQERNFNLEALFGAGQVPEKYTNPKTKLDNDFIALLDTKPALKAEVEQIRTAKAQKKGEVLREKFIQMMQFMEDNADAHFDPGRPERTALKTASVQALSTLGQIIHDHLCDTRIASRGKLFEEYKQLGLINENTLKLVTEFDMKGRQSPLLAEVKNEEIKNAIYNAMLNNSEIREQLRGQFITLLTSVRDDDHLQLTDEEIAEVADELIQQAAQEIKDLATNYAHSNPRGRTKFDQSTPAYVKKLTLGLRGEGKKNSVVTMPDANDNPSVQQEIFQALKIDEPINEGLSYGSRPIIPLRGGTGLDSKIVYFQANPQTPLVNVLNNKFTLKKFDISADDIVSAFGGIEQVPKQYMTDPKIDLNKPLTAEMIDALIRHDFPNEPESFTATSANGLVEVTINNNQEIIHCKVKTEISVAPEENQRLIDEALAAAKDLANQQTSVLQEGKTLRQLGFATEAELKKAFQTSHLPFEKIIENFPEEFFQPFEIDLNKGLSPGQVKELSDRHIIELSEKDKLFIGLSQRFAKASAKPTTFFSLLQPGNPQVERFNRELKKIVGKIQVPYNDAVRGQTISLEEFAQKDSIAKIMMKHNLRTICSISGTTLDTFVGLNAVLSTEELKALLEPIINQAERLKSGDRSVDLLPAETKKFISAISVFMNGPPYHSLAEVVGGSFIAARALFTSKEDNINIKETDELFDALMEDLSLHREHYIYCDPNTLPQINTAVENAMEAIHTEPEIGMQSVDAAPPPSSGRIRGR